MSTDPPVPDATAQRVGVTLSVNGRVRTAELEPNQTLADTLRELGLLSVKLGCEQGVCGSCTVLVDGQAVRSCLALGVQADGAEVETVEGLAVDGDLNALQRRFHEHHALQCGYCTAGFLMLATAFLRENPQPSRDEAVAVLSSNLCRCTGYQGLIDAVVAVGHDDTDEHDHGETPR